MPGMTRFDLIEKSFKTVMESDIHEDNKASRILTAMAFLTTASAAIFSKVYTQGSLMLTLVFTWPLKLSLDWPLVSFVGYIIVTLVSAGFYLAALGPSLNIPSWFSSKSNDSTPKSILFFKHIAEMKDNAWKDYWTKNDEKSLQCKMFDDYVAETHLISQKEVDKVFFMSWGSGFLKLAILAFACIVSNVFEVISAKWFIGAATISLSAVFLIECIKRRPTESKRLRKLLYLLFPVAAIFIIEFTLH